MPTAISEHDTGPDVADHSQRLTPALEALRYRDAYRNALAELADLRAVARPDVGEVARLKSEIVQIKRSAVEAERSHAAQLADLQRRLTSAEEHATRLTARIAEIERSRSWRLMAPVRMLGTLVRGLRGRGPTA